MMIASMRWTFGLSLWLIMAPSWAQLSISEPNATLGSVRQAALNRRAKGDSPSPGSRSPVAKSTDGSSSAQVRVKVFYLQVDGETRQAIYEDLLGSHPPRTTTTVPPDSLQVDLPSVGPADHCSEQVTTVSRVTTCVLDQLANLNLQQQISRSSHSEILKSPTVHLLQGTEGEMNDVTHHPCVIEMRQRELGLEPVIRVYDEGIRVRLLAFINPSSSPSTEASSAPGEASATPGEDIELTAEVTSSRILDIVSEMVFGFGDEPLTLQSPQVSIKKAIASVTLRPSQALLIDLHDRRSRRVRDETPATMFSKVPYVGQSFKNVRDVEVDQYLMLLLQPSVAVR